MKKFINLISCLFFVGSLFIGCSSHNDSQNFKHQSSSFENSQIICEFDTIKLSVNYSGKGIINMLSDSIVLVDELYKRISFFNKEGKLLDSYDFFDVLKGIKSNYFNQSAFFTRYKRNYILLNGRKLTYFSEKMIIDSTYRLKFKRNGTIKTLMDNPTPSSMDIYEINLRNKSYLKLGNKVFIGLESEHPKFNPYTSKYYFENANSYGIINLDDKTVLESKIFKSRIYKDTCCLSFQDGVSISKSENEDLFVQYGADSFFYVYDKNMNPKEKFGLMNGHNLSLGYNNGLEIAFDENLYISRKKNLNYFGEVFHLSNSNIYGRFFIDNLEYVKIIQFFKKYNLIKELKIPFNSEFIGSYGNKIFLMLENLQLCIISFS